MNVNTDILEGVTINLDALSPGFDVWVLDDDSGPLAAENVDAKDWIEGDNDEAFLLRTSCLMTSSGGVWAVSVLATMKAWGSKESFEWLI